MLAAAEAIEERAQFQTSAVDLGLNHPDIRVPTALADVLDLDYRILRPRSVTDEFAALIQDEYLNPRLSRMRGAQRLHSETSPSETVSIGGNGGEIMRAYYKPIRSPPTPEFLAEIYHYPDSEFVRGEFAEWLPGAERYAERTGIDILDLFYWEHRMGNWAARTAYEADIATTAMQPFNNYRNRWNLRLEDSKTLLPQLVDELEPIDLFLHDSLHTYGHMFWEYETVYDKLRSGGVLATHDIILNDAFQDFVGRKGMDWTEIKNVGLARKG